MPSRQSTSRWLLRPEQWSPLLDLVDDRPVLAPVVCVLDAEPPRFTRPPSHAYARRLRAQHTYDNAARPDLPSGRAA